MTVTWDENTERVVLAGMLKGRYTGAFKSLFFSELYQQMFCGILAATRHGKFSMDALLKCVDTVASDRVAHITRELLAMDPTQYEVDNAESHMKRLYLDRDDPSERIPIDWYVAREWMNEAFVACNEIGKGGLLEYMYALPPDRYAEHIEFCRECLSRGVKPMHFVNAISDMYERHADDMLDMNGGQSDD